MKIMVTCRSFTYLSILILCNNIACKRPPIRPKPLNYDTYWTLASSPNSYDDAGVIFAVDSKGKITRIPGGRLEMKIDENDIKITKQNFDKYISIGATTDFLKIKNIDSTSTGSVSAKDSIYLNVNFNVENGRLNILNGNLKDAFNKKRELIESNVEILNLGKQKLYLILETIKSNKVEITFNKATIGEVNAEIKLKKILNTAPKANFKIITDNSLIYNLDEHLVVFYHLVPLKVNQVSRGDEKSYEVYIDAEDKNQQELKK